MNENENIEKILSGDSMRPPEADDNENYDTIEDDASVEYNMASIVDNIGTPDFKFVYMNLIDLVKTNTNIDDKRLFCKRILEKILDVYDFEFLPPPKLDNEFDIQQVLALITFIEYDHIEFFGAVWRYLDDIMTVDLETYCNKNIDKILSEVENQIDSYDLPVLISNFLRTYNKDDFIPFIIKISERNRVLLKIRILELKGEIK